MDMKSISLKDIKTSGRNARQTFDEAKMKELTASVKEKGIINPILVRLLGKTTQRGPAVRDVYELVCGERRMRAAAAAGLEEIPAVIRQLTDQQALECMVIENLQREDVHPLEEAEGYEALMKKHGYKDVKDIAAKVGKSPTYIYGRLKLCELIPENRKLFYDGKFSPSVALLVARVPKDLQKEAGVQVAKGGQWGKEPYSYREAQEYIHKNFMLQLKEAQFDTKEKGLAGKGSCVDCPKRTGNQKELFADVSAADTCTDPGCFEAKKQARTQRTITRLKAQGKEVVSQEEAKKLFEYESDTTPERKYSNVDERNYYNHKYLSLRQLFKASKDVKTVFAVHPFSGKIIEMVNNADVPKILRKAGIKLNASEGPRVKDLAKSKTENRVREAKRGFWISKVSVTKDQRCRNVLTLFILLNDMGWSESQAIVKDKIKGGKEYGRPYSIPKIYELGDTVVQELIGKVIAEKPKVIDDEDLNFLSTKLGFSMAKDYVIAESYLQAMTKDQLAKLAKELNVNIDTTEDKKSALVAFILKNAPKGKVPKELVK
ncbi:MAG: ParB/RepB/Spo0J family partition protein [Candidatus Omnitrophota bacterium]|jgi:ParB/RepB/Spo0J family partition protein|nr:MAG: ParB/RepB/Spo0J family partition protein [Candidatus Omnitrophota bacterium]